VRGSSDAFLPSLLSSARLHRAVNNRNTELIQQLVTQQGVSVNEVRHVRCALWRPVAFSGCRAPPNSRDEPKAPASASPEPSNMLAADEHEA
jgi:hypothetical protein